MDVSYVQPASASYLATKLRGAYGPFPAPTGKTEDCALAVLAYLQEKGVKDRGIIAVATDRQTGAIYVALSAGLLATLNDNFFTGKGGYDAIATSLQAHLQKKFGKERLPAVLLCTAIQQAMSRQCARPSCAEPKILSCLRQLGRKMAGLCVIGYPDYEQTGYDVISSDKMTYLHPCKDCQNFAGNYL